MGSTRVCSSTRSPRTKDLELLDELEPDQEQVEGDAELQLELKRRRRLPLDDYTRALVAGVAARRPAIDAVLGEVADRWPVHRMPAVDRNLLRLAVYELAEQDTPNAVVIDEAVALSIAFAGEKARSFVNGVLETIRQQVVAGDLVLDIASRPVTVEDEPTEAPDEADATAEPRDVAATTEVAAPDTSTDDVDAEATGDVAEVEVDPAAQEAYDLALDLLDGEEDLDGWSDDDLDDDDRFAEASLEAPDLADELGLDLDLDDEDDALW